jgi:RimJ/RimL family protein N-acetyltransferase
LLRPAMPRDADDIRRWRNHHEVRAVSLTAHEIGTGEHAAWFAAATADPSRRVLIYEHADRPSGVVNFTDIRAGRASWGFFLDVEGLARRDETLPAWMHICREAVDYAFDELRLVELTGEVLAPNVAVRRMNRRLGFTETSSRLLTRDGEAVECLSISLCRADRRPRATGTPTPTVKEFSK